MVVQQIIGEAEELHIVTEGGHGDEEQAWEDAAINGEGKT